MQTEVPLTVTLKNDLKIEGILKEIDQNMNLRLDVTNSRTSLPQYMQNLSQVFIRGSSIRTIGLDKADVTQQLPVLTSESAKLF